MGKVLVILFVSLAVLAVIAAAHRHQRQAIDPSKIASLLNNQAYVAAQRKCLLATDSDAASLCDKVGKRLRENLVPSIKEGECFGTCTDRERESLAMIIVTVKKKYPRFWTEVCDRYQVSPEESDRAESWANDVLAKKN